MESKLENHPELLRFLLAKDGLTEKLIKLQGTSLPHRTFEDEHYAWTILGAGTYFESKKVFGLFRKGPAPSDYYTLFKSYFGEPIKGPDFTVLAKETELAPYIEFINRMNGFLSGAGAIEEGLMTLEQLAFYFIHQQGGIIRPLINLFDGQALYAKNSEPKIIELARICPFPSNPESATIEYMACFSK